MKKIILFVILAVAPFYGHCAESISFNEALATAKKHEVMPLYSKFVTSSIVPYYQKIMDRAVADCVTSEDEAKSSSFTIVMEISQFGNIANTWLDTENSISKCIEKHFKRSTAPIPPFTPYFTYMQWSATPDQ